MEVLFEVDSSPFNPFSSAFRQRVDAIHNLARLIRPYNDSNTDYPKDLVREIRPLYDEYLQLMQYSSLVEEASIYPAIFNAEVRRRIEEIGIRLDELKLLNIKDSLLNPHRVGNEGGACVNEKKSFWKRLIG